MIESTYRIEKMAAETVAQINHINYVYRQYKADLITEREACEAMKRAGC